MTTLELVKVMKNNNRNAKFIRRGSTPRKEYNGVSSLYDGEGRGYWISSGEKAVGAVTNLAESKI